MDLKRVLQSEVAFGGPIKVLLDGFVKPFIGLLIFGGVGGAFVFGGWYTAQVSANRLADGQVTVTVERMHFWGLLKSSKTLPNVERAEILTRSSSGTRSGRSISGPTLTSGAYAISGDKKLSLLGFSSNVDSDKRRRIVDSLNSYLKSDAGAFEEVIHIRNLFAWFGLPLFATGLWILLGWPFAILKAFQNYSKRDAVKLVPSTTDRA